MTADRVTLALIGAMRQLIKGLGGETLVRESRDAALVISGVPFPTMNGVLTVRPSVSPHDVEELLDVDKLETVPHSIQIRPGCSQAIVDLAVERGMKSDEPIPLMAMDRPTPGLRAAASRSELSIRTIEPAEAALHAQVAAQGFELPIEVFNTFAIPSVLAQPGIRAYVGTVAGIPVTTALGLVGDEYVGIFDVATPPEHRGRGYGAAITARATLDGFDAGASFSFLQSSAMGFQVYERLGYRALETWSVWVKTPGQRLVA